MTEYSEGEPPKDLSAEVTALAGKLGLVHAEISERIETLQSTGATPEDKQQLIQVSDQLNALGRKALEGAELINTADIPLQKVEAERPEIDEERAYSLVKEFIDSRSGGLQFKTIEIRYYLEERGIRIDSGKFSRWFKNWRDEILEEYLERGEKVVWWNNGENGAKRIYALALLNTVTEKPAEPAVEAITYVWKPKSEQIVEITDEHRRVALQFVTAAKPGDRAKLIVEQLAERFGISLQNARRICEESVAAGTIYSQRTEGSLFYSAQPFMDRPTAKTAKKEKRPQFTDEDARLTDRLMQVLDAQRGAKHSGLLPRELVALMDEDGMTEAVVKRLARLLSEEGKAELRVTKQRSGGVQPRVIVPYSARKDLGTPEVRKQTIRAIRARFQQ